MLAQLLFEKMKRGQKGGGFMCFGKPKVLDDNDGDASDPITRRAITENFGELDRLLFFDIQDFADFRERYNNCQTGPSDVVAGGSPKEKKRYKGRSYVVRTGPRGGKYILRNKEKVYI